MYEHEFPWPKDTCGKIGWKSPMLLEKPIIYKFTSSWWLNYGHKTYELGELTTILVLKFDKA